MLLNQNFTIFENYNLFNMEAYIRYQRFSEYLNKEEIQPFFDKLVTEGWQILYYTEKELDRIANSKDLYIIIVAGKTSSQIKNIL